jgi:hypothetical protein
MGKWFSRIKDTWSWGRFAWQLAAALGLTGFLSSVAGTALAMIQGVPTPIAMMVGYCTLVGAVYLAMAPLAYRALALTPANKIEKKKKIIPNYVAWRHLESYQIMDAAKLWCDVDPNAGTTTDTSAWMQAFIAAVKKGTLTLEYCSSEYSRQDRERHNPTSDSKITRESLQAFAKATGHDPIFLRDA